MTSKKEISMVNINLFLHNATAKLNKEHRFSFNNIKNRYALNLTNDRSIFLSYIASFDGNETDIYVAWEHRVCNSSHTKHQSISCLMKATQKQDIGK